MNIFSLRQDNRVVHVREPPYADKFIFPSLQQRLCGWLFLLGKSAEMSMGIYLLVIYRPMKIHQVLPVPLNGYQYIHGRGEGKHEMGLSKTGRIFEIIIINGKNAFSFQVKPSHCRLPGPAEFWRLNYGSSVMVYLNVAGRSDVNVS